MPIRELLTSKALPLGRVAQAAYFGHQAAAVVTGIKASTPEDLREWLDHVPTAGSKPSQPDDDVLDAARRAEAATWEAELAGIDPELDQLLAATSTPTPVACQQLAFAITSSELASKIPNVEALMQAMLSLAFDGIRFESSPPSHYVGELHLRAGLAAIRAVVGEPTERLLKQVREALLDFDMRDESQRDYWLRDLPIRVEAELKLVAAESKLSGLDALLADWMHDTKDRAEVRNTAWTRCDAALDAVMSKTGKALDRLLRTAERNLKDAAPDPIRAELIPWLLGTGDPLRERAERLG